MSVAIHPELDSFARDNALDGLTEPSLRAIAEGREGYTVEKAKRFLEFQARIDSELLKHSIITDNTINNIKFKNSNLFQYLKDNIIYLAQDKFDFMWCHV